MKLTIVSGTLSGGNGVLQRITRAFVKGIDSPDGEVHTYHRQREADDTAVVSLPFQGKKDAGISAELIRGIDSARTVLILGSRSPALTEEEKEVIAGYRRLCPSVAAVIALPQILLFESREAEPVTGPRLMRITEAGREYSRTGTLCEETLRQISSPMIDETIYAKMMKIGLGS